MTYERYLDEVIDGLFDESVKQQINWQDWATKSGLSYATVYQLGMRETVRPQLRTVFLLSRALGINLPTIIKNHLRKVG